MLHATQLAHVSVLTDSYAKNLSDQEYKVFWKNINKCSNAAATKHASVVNGCNGESNIAAMWCNHFEKLYNSITDDRSLFYEHLDKITDNNSQFVIRVRELSECINKQKRGKAVGLDGISSEAVQNYMFTCVYFLICF